MQVKKNPKEVPLLLEKPCGQKVPYDTSFFYKKCAQMKKNEYEMYIKLLF